jgi:hypothetical protein
MESKKEKRKIYYKEYYLKNKERIKERITNYNRINRDIIRQKNKKNRLIRKEINRQYYLKKKHVDIVSDESEFILNLN